VPCAGSTLAGRAGGSPIVSTIHAGSRRSGLGARLSADAACDELDATPAQLALAFALQGPGVASVLFGATTAEQVEENVGALAVLERLTEHDLAYLHALAEAGA
jgi:aryl-alcohol dehydrogenase-like predicted oxidoreductase